MTPQIFSAAIVIASIVLYQLSMKSIPAGLNPFVALITFYLTALVGTLIVAKLVPQFIPLLATDSSSSAAPSGVPWTAVFVGLAIVGIELGYLLMYRSGWNLAAAPLVAMGGATIILAIIGFAVFRQPVTMRTIIGIILCIYSLYLLSPAQR